MRRMRLGLGGGDAVDLGPEGFTGGEVFVGLEDRDDSSKFNNSLSPLVSPGMIRRMNRSNSGTVCAVSPWLGLQTKAVGVRSLVGGQVYKG
jgi:hypothetical protein